MSIELSHWISGFLCGLVIKWLALVCYDVISDIECGKRDDREASHKIQVAEGNLLHRNSIEQTLDALSIGFPRYTQRLETQDRQAFPFLYPSECHFCSELRSLVTDEYDWSRSMFPNEAHYSSQHECLHGTYGEFLLHSGGAIVTGKQIGRAHV